MKRNVILLSMIAFIAIFFSSCLSPKDGTINMSDDLEQDSLKKDTSMFSVDMEKQTIENGNANYMFTKIIFPAGRIRLESSETDLMNGSFKYTNDEWKPEISYTEKGDTGNITIEPKSTVNNINFNDSDTCRWIIGLNKQKFYELEMEAGACKGELNLEGFNIKKIDFNLGAGSVNINLKNTSVPDVEISVGAGKAVVDLTGIWKNNLVAKIAGGVGEVEIHLPKDFGVKAEVNGLLGEVMAEGFTKKHNNYTNSVYGKTEFNLILEVDGAIGKVKLIQE